MKKKNILLLSVILVVSALYAQNTGQKHAAGEFVEGFRDALRSDTVSSFIDNRIYSKSQLREIVDRENRDQGISADDPNRLTVEIVQAYMNVMQQGLAGSLNYSINAAEILNGIDFTNVEISDFELVLGYGEPPVFDIKILTLAGSSDVVFYFMNLSLLGGSLIFGSSARVEVMDYEVQDVIAYHIIEALKKQDAGYYLENVLASKNDFPVLFKAAMGLGSGSEDFGIDIDEAYEQIRTRLSSDFNNLVSIGIAEGVDWSSIEKTWSGYSSSYQGEVYQTSIPFQFLSDGIEYRVILDYCTQLSTRKDVFLPGEFRWEGKL